MNPVLPPVDPLPLPAPVWLIVLLQTVTFILHLLAMNLLMGGGVLAAISGARGKANVPHHRKLAETIGGILPVVTAATITLGIAPLLFIQVLYGRFFFTSSILLAVPWILVIVLLCLAYYGHYFSALSETVRRERFLWVAWLSALFVIAIGFIYTNNLTLMQTPERFRELYLSGRSGLRLNLAEPTLLPRFLHFFVASLAVAGLGTLLIGHHARRRGDPKFGTWAARYGMVWFAGATMVQVLVGFWFLLSQPDAIRAAFLGGSIVHTVHLFGAAFLALAAVFLIVMKPDSRRHFWISAALLVVTVVVMVLVRHWVRRFMIGDVDGFEQMSVETQWGVLPIFLVLFVASLGVIGWMLRRMRIESGATPDRID
ncbi:MAG: hypothetical protein GF346_11780 [Candidatus Eisenbacteria bacterium]|nr:hypothetical protein [Candidatus Latescibacterota bacterium]MBD3303116.1 hypothetical protein [Candidatus Eisenbacteria bacterium]